MLILFLTEFIFIAMFYCHQVINKLSYAITFFLSTLFFRRDNKSLPRPVTSGQATNPHLTNLSMNNNIYHSDHTPSQRQQPAQQAHNKLAALRRRQAKSERRQNMPSSSDSDSDDDSDN